MTVISGTDDQWWPTRSVETTPESAQATKSVAGIDRKPSQIVTRKRGWKSNGVTRKASLSPVKMMPASSSDPASLTVELLEPNTIKMWGNLPS